MSSGTQYFFSDDKGFVSLFSMINPSLCQYRYFQPVENDAKDEDEITARRKSGMMKKEGCNKRTSQEVTHLSTTLAQARLTSEF